MTVTMVLLYRSTTQVALLKLTHPPHPKGAFQRYSRMVIVIAQSRHGIGLCHDSIHSRVVAHLNNTNMRCVPTIVYSYTFVLY